MSMARRPNATRIAIIAAGVSLATLASADPRDGGGAFDRDAARAPYQGYRDEQSAADHEGHRRRHLHQNSRNDAGQGVYVPYSYADDYGGWSNPPPRPAPPPSPRGLHNGLWYY